jgi:outer membrane protein assembly factor BamB
MDTHHRLGNRTLWHRCSLLFIVLLLAVPLIARETIVLQKSATDTQARGGDATLNQASPNSNNVGPTLTVESLASANRRAVVEFDLSRIPNVGIKQALLTLHVTTPPPVSAGTLTYGAYDVATFWQPSSVTWDSRVETTAWGIPGGDIGGTATNTTTVNNSSTIAQIDITSDVEGWYNGNPNYGTLVKDQTENDATAASTVFGSKEAFAATNAPELDVTFVQNVTNLKATALNAAVQLNWTIPAAIGTFKPGESYVGVLILRRSSIPVDRASVPTDTTDPGLCATIGTATVVFDDTSGKQTFTDNVTNDTCSIGPPHNGITYYYKVFLRDNLNYYSSQPISNGSTYTEEISASPAAGASAQSQSLWMANTASTSLAAPSLIPGSVTVIGSQSNLLFMVNPNTGLRVFPPVSIGGAVTSRSSLIDSGSSSTGDNVVYVADQDGLVYAVSTDTGVILWVANPTGVTATPFQGAAAVQLKSVSSASYTLATDLLAVGTRNTATTTGNQIFGLNGNTGATIWSKTGGVSGFPSLDMINSTPLIDYTNQAIWVTSRSACGATQPSLWKLNPNTGAVLATANFGDTDTSATLSFLSDVLFVATNGDFLSGTTCTAGNGQLYAVNPTTGQMVTAPYAVGDGAIVSFPLVLNTAPPYTVIFSGAAAVHAVSYDPTGSTFTDLWDTTISVPSAPLSLSSLSDVFVGSADGKIHELDITSGADLKQLTVDTGTPGVVGDPALDITLSNIYVSTSDQRAYGFIYPF